MVVAIMLIKIFVILDPEQEYLESLFIYEVVGSTHKSVQLWLIT